MRVRSLVVTASIASGVIVATMFAESLSSTSAQTLYMQTNEIRNAIIHYSRSANGMITEVERIPTGGAGSGEFKRKDDLAVRGRAYSHVQPRCHAHGHAGSPKCVTLRPYGAGTGLEARDRATISLADRNPSKYGGPTARDSSVRQPPEAEEKAL